MVVEKLVSSNIFFEHYQLFCDKCGKLLGDVYYRRNNVIVVPKGSCEHYEWKTAISLPTYKELFEKGVIAKAFYTGYNYYVLIRR